MYLNVNIIVIILLYQCLTVYTAGLFSEKFHLPTVTAKPENKGCILWSLDKFAARMPLSVKLDSTLQLRRDIYGRVIIKRDKVFKLACTPAKFTLSHISNTSEITVKCLSGENLEHDGLTIAYKNFICDGIPDPKLIVFKKFYKKVQSVPENQRNPGAYGCFYLMPYADNNYPLPFLANKTHSEIIRPGKSGLLTVAKNATFHFTCTGNKFVSPDIQASEITVRCLNQSYLDYKGKEVQFSQFRCEDIPKPTLIKSKSTCQEVDYSVLEVGFQTKLAFLPSYKICFDKKYKNTIYSWYFAQSPTYEYIQKPKQAPEFIQSNQFGKTDVFHTYVNQTRTMEKIVSSKALANWYIKQHEGIRYITHGQLVTSNDFIYAAEQASTYYFENTVPQWFIFNKGIWKDLERLFRKNLNRGRSKHLIITGTYGHSTLPNMELTQNKLYLSLPKSMKVPLFMWKMDYNLDRELGIVFIGLNNPYRTLDKSIYICEVISCPGHLVRKDYSKELLYCCTKESFEKVYGRIDPIVYNEF